MTTKIRLNREQSRAVDQIAINDFGIPGIVLMENAGRNIAEKLVQHFPDRNQAFVICCGNGNNGGDGFVVARHLANHNYLPKVLLFCDREKIQGDAKTNLEILDHTNISVEPFRFPSTSLEFEKQISLCGHTKTGCIVDAWLGTGAIGTPRPPLNSVIPRINQIDIGKVAIDIPTGLDCDSGIPANPTFIADRTYTMVAEKTGFQNPKAKNCLGIVDVIDIGIPGEVIKKAQSV